MTLRATLTADEFEDLPDALSSHYIVDGDGYRLDLDGVHSDDSVSALRNRYAAELAARDTALQRANARLKDFDEAPVTVDQVRAPDGKAVQKAKGALSDDESDGQGSDDSGDTTTDLLDAAKAEYSDLEERQRRVRIRAALDPLLDDVDSMQLRRDVEKIALNRFTVDKDGKIVANDPATDGDFELFVKAMAQGAFQGMASGGGGARGSGRVVSGSSGRQVLDGFARGKRTLTEVGQAVNLDPSLIPDVQKLLRG
ncbi:MAG: hypothetical protein AAF648_16950 [Pseudomonadota bacterium]